MSDQKPPRKPRKRIKASKSFNATSTTGRAIAAETYTEHNYYTSADNLQKNRHGIVDEATAIVAAVNEERGWN